MFSVGRWSRRVTPPRPCPTAPSWAPSWDHFPRLSDVGTGAHYSIPVSSSGSAPFTNPRNVPRPPQVRPGEPGDAHVRVQPLQPVLRSRSPAGARGVPCDPIPSAFPMSRASSHQKSTTTVPRARIRLPCRVADAGTVMPSVQARPLRSRVVSGPIREKSVAPPLISAVSGGVLPFLA